MRAEACGWFSWDYDIISNGTHITTIHTLFLGPVVCYFEIDGHRYEISSKGKNFSMRHDNVVVCGATKPSVWRNSFRVKFNDEEFVLKAASTFFFPSADYVLLEGSSELGNISPEGFFFGVTFYLPDRLPMAVRIFMVSLVIIQQMRDRGD